MICEALNDITRGNLYSRLSFFAEPLKGRGLTPRRTLSWCSSSFYGQRDIASEFLQDNIGPFAHQNLRPSKILRLLGCGKHSSAENTDF